MVEIKGVGKEISHIERELAAGTYQVRVRGKKGTKKRTVTLNAGQRMRLVIESPKRSVFRKPWIYIGLGAAAAALTTTTVMLTRNRGTDSVVDPTFDNTEALHAR